MAFPNLVQALYNALIGSDNVTFVVVPLVGTSPIAAVSDGAAAAKAYAAWVQMVAAAAGAGDPEWFSGLTLATGVVETFDAIYQIGTGAGGAEVGKAQFSVTGGIPTAVGISVSPSHYVPRPIRITGNPRIAVRLAKSTAASAAGFSARTIFGLGFGT